MDGGVRLGSLSQKSPRSGDHPRRGRGEAEHVACCRASVRDGERERYQRCKTRQKPQERDPCCSLRLVIPRGSYVVEDKGKSEKHQADSRDQQPDKAPPESPVEGGPVPLRLIDVRYGYASRRRRDAMGGG